MFRGLRHRNYRLFFIGQTLSLIGTWMEQTAMSWLVFQLTGSSLWLGTVAFVGQLPMFILSPYAGVITDRLDKRKMLIFVQILFALAAGTLTVLVLAHLIKPWHLLVLGAFVGTVAAFDMPGRQTLVIQLVEDRADLSNAIALNSAQFNLARLIGPPLAGLTMAKGGAGVCFLINTISFIAVIIGMFMMRLRPHEAPARERHVWRELKEGAQYCWANVPIRALLGLMMVMSFVAGSQGVLLPVIATRLGGREKLFGILLGGEVLFGILLGAAGIGAMFSALKLAQRRSVFGITHWLLTATFLSATAILCLGWSTRVWLSFPILVVIGGAGMMHFGATNTLIQSIVDDHVRGRIMAFYTMSFVGTMPLGSLCAGALEPHIGLPWVLTGASVLGFIAVYVFYRSLPAVRAALRPVYEAKGIVRDPA